LLRAAAKLGESHIKVLESVITGGADIYRYGAAALSNATPEAALVLLEAGVPVTSDPAVRQQLLWLVLEYQVNWRAKQLESALGSLKRTKVSSQYVHGVVPSESVRGVVSSRIEHCIVGWHGQACMTSGFCACIADHTCLICSHLCVSTHHGCRSGGGEGKAKPDGEHSSRW
jgi:hypothetical protein